MSSQAINQNPRVENNSPQTSESSSITSNPTAQKVKNFFISCKDTFVYASMASYNYCKTHIINCYKTYAKMAKEFLSNHKLLIITLIATLLLALFAIALPKLALAALILFAVCSIVHHFLGDKKHS